jgi:hypothetical protein
MINKADPPTVATGISIGRLGRRCSMRRGLRECRSCAKRRPWPDAASPDIDKPRRVACALPLWGDVTKTRLVSRGLWRRDRSMVQPVNLEAAALPAVLRHTLGLVVDEIRALEAKIVGLDLWRGN